MSDGQSPGEGPERNPDGTYNKSQVSQVEQQQKQGGNPADDRARQERINREHGLHEGGFPVAGHDPGRERSQ
jgi:hypothetical protein